METHCSFAFPGTYGHECGSAATMVGIGRTDLTKDGIYYARRCDKCATHKGGENTGITQWQRYDTEKHVNNWK